MTTPKAFDRGNDSRRQPDSQLRRRPYSLRQGAILLLIGACLAVDYVSGLRAQDSPDLATLEAAYLIAFGKFVEWPPAAFSDPGSPMIIGVVDADPIGEILDLEVVGRQVQGHPLEVRRWDHVNDVGNCHILFISTSELRSFSRQWSRLNATPALTVAESETFLSQGGMIRLILDKQKVRFEISNISARKAGLKISSRLLALAAKVLE